VNEMGAVETERLTRRALRLAQFTVAYNVIEGAVSITAGVLAGLVSLIGFGLDSGIESTASVLVGLRLAARLRHGEADEAKERRALKAVAVTFFVLAAYILVEGIRSLTGGEVPDRSTVGIVLLTSSVIVMPLLARQAPRRGTARRRPAHPRRRRRDQDLRSPQHLHPRRTRPVQPHRRSLARPRRRVRHRRLRHPRGPRGLGGRTCRGRRVREGVAGLRPVGTSDPSAGVLVPYWRGARRGIVAARRHLSTPWSLR
jgi:hypothetical protein